MATSKSKQVKRKDPGPKPGRPSVSDAETTMLHIRIDRAQLGHFDEACREKFKADRATVLRWLLDDVIDGAWFPSHLRRDK